MLPAAYVQPPDSACVYPQQSRRPFDTIAFTQMLADRDRFFFRDFAVPQSRVLALAKLFPAASTTQITDRIVLTICFPDSQVLLPGLLVKLTFREDTC